MSKKILVVLVSLGLVFSAMTVVCFAETPVELKNQARGLMKAKEYEQAEAIYKALINDYPDTEYDFLARKNLVVIYIKLGRYSEAEEVLDSLVEDFSENTSLPRWLYRIAKKYTREGKYEKAKSIFELIKQQYPDSSKIEGSQDHIRELEVLFLVQSSNYTEAQQALNKLVEDYSGHRSLPGMLYDIATEYQASGRYDEAKNIYGDIITDYPQTDNAKDAKESLVSLYVSLEADGQLEGSLDRLTADYSGHSGLPAMLYIIAERCKRQERYEEAKSIYRTIARDHSGTESAFKANKELALIYITSGEELKADAVLDSLLSDFSGHPLLPAAVTRVAEQYYIEAFRMEGEGLISQAKGYFQKAVSIWQMVIDELPEPNTMPKACCWAGDCYHTLGVYEKSGEYFQKSKDCFQKVTEDYSDYEYAWHALFMVGRNYVKLQELGAVSESEAGPKIKAIYEQLIEVYPTCPAARYAQDWLNAYNSQ